MRNKLPRSKNRTLFLACARSHSPPNSFAGSRADLKGHRDATRDWTLSRRTKEPEVNLSLALARFQFPNAH